MKQYIKLEWPYWGIVAQFRFSFFHAASMVLDDKSQYAEDEEGEGDSGANSNGGNIFDTTLIENIQNQVTIL